jgi:hypothetical protein
MKNLHLLRNSTLSYLFKYSVILRLKKVNTFIQCTENFKVIVW